MIEEFVATIQRGFALFQADAAQLPPLVLAWMWAMRITLGASIVFLRRPGAIATLAVMLATAVSRFYIKGLYPEMPASNIGALTHVVLWIPLAAYLLYSWRNRRPYGNATLERAYAIWLPVALAVLAISLIFDIREVIAMPG